MRGGQDRGGGFEAVQRADLAAVCAVPDGADEHVRAHAGERSGGVRAAPQG